MSKKIQKSVKNHWQKMEKAFLSVYEIHGFQEFLNSYRGVAPQNIPHTSEEDQNHFLVGLSKCIDTIILESGSYQTTKEEQEKQLLELEKIINLMLYYWFGKQDKNYQFRTCIHFLNLNHSKIKISEKNDIPFFLFVSEEGVLLTTSDKTDRTPHILPASQIYPLKLTHSPVELISQIHAVQREVCLLIDQWEYLNSIFAMEFHLGILRMEKRTDLAIWVLRSFRDFQNWILELKKHLLIHENHNLDAQEELEALSSLLLSSIQKILLPASISRICYPKQVRSLFKDVFTSRLAYEPLDYSSKLMLQVLESAEGHDFSIDLLDVLDLKPHEWKLCFDPNNAIRSFCWSYSTDHHHLLCALTAIAYIKKSAPKKQDSHFLIEIISSIHAKQSFAHIPSHEKIHQNLCSISDEKRQALYSQLFYNLENNLKTSDSSPEQINFLRKTFLEGKTHD